MQINYNYSALLCLGEELRQNGIPQEVKKRAEEENFLFNSTQIDAAVSALANDMLVASKIDSWLPAMTPKYKSCLVIMAGNIPLVGFFDMMCVLLLNIDCYVKPSSKDNTLMCWVIGKLKEYGCTSLHLYSKDIEVESVIATGSDNAGRYFNQKYGHLPTVIRGSRSSVAIIAGDETLEDIDNLWHDIFDYYGLGCRSVSHIFIPENYDIESLIAQLSEKKINSEHFRNSYRQIRAIKILKGEEFIDGKFFIATKSQSLTPQLSEITYSYFTEGIISENRDKIQCVVGKNHTPFGESQHPTLNDWADGVNLFDFFIGN